VLTNNEIELLKNITVLQLAQMLEDGLLNAGWLDENISVHKFIKEYLSKQYEEVYNLNNKEDGK
jgi:hypothetical protein